MKRCGLDEVEQETFGFDRFGFSALEYIQAWNNVYNNSCAFFTGVARWLIVPNAENPWRKDQTAKVGTIAITSVASLHSCVTLLNQTKLGLLTRDLLAIGQRASSREKKVINRSNISFGLGSARRRSIWNQFILVSHSGNALLIVQRGEKLKHQIDRSE